MLGLSRKPVFLEPYRADVGQRRVQSALLQDTSLQLRHWLDTMANVRVHAGTQRVLQERFQEERPSLQTLPGGRFDAVLRQEQRLSSEGCVSVVGNYYSVPDGTRRRTLEVETTADQVHIHEDRRLFAVHTPLQGRKQRSILPGHRQAPRRSTSHNFRDSIRILPGHAVTTRPLILYEQIGRQLGGRPCPVQVHTPLAAAAAAPE